MSKIKLIPVEVLSAGIFAFESHSELTAKYKLSCGLVLTLGLVKSPAPRER
ncbi:hypothetical protein LBGG_02029 [Lactobacillus gasseri MV-22]|nr:hypothetical protein LBGG_02029 [Lactobacillus gasseri MV-22]